MMEKDRSQGPRRLSSVEALLRRLVKHSRGFDEVPTLEQQHPEVVCGSQREGVVRFAGFTLAGQGLALQRLRLGKLALLGEHDGEVVEPRHQGGVPVAEESSGCLESFARQRRRLHYLTACVQYGCEVAQGRQRRAMLIS